MTPEESVALGKDAQAFLNDNAAFRHVVTEVQGNMLKAFKGDDDDLAMEARREAKILETLITRMARQAEIGRVTEKKLEEERASAAEHDGNVA